MRKGSKINQMGWRKRSEKSGRKIGLISKSLQSLKNTKSGNLKTRRIGINLKWSLPSGNFSKKTIIHFRKISNWKRTCFTHRSFCRRKCSGVLRRTIYQVTWKERFVCYITQRKFTVFSYLFKHENWVKLNMWSLRLKKNHFKNTWALVWGS